MAARVFHMIELHEKGIKSNALVSDVKFALALAQLGCDVEASKGNCDFGVGNSICFPVDWKSHVFHDPAARHIRMRHIIDERSQIAQTRWGL